MTLFEISTQVREMFADIEADGGEVTDEQLAALHLLTGTADAKVDVVCGLIEEANARISGRTATLDRLRIANAVDKNRVERLKAFLLNWLQTSGYHGHQTALHTVSRCKSPPSAACIVDPAELMPAFQRVKIEANSAAAIDHWKKYGEPPDGFEIHDGNEHVRLR